MRKGGRGGGRGGCGTREVISALSALQLDKSLVSSIHPQPFQNQKEKRRRRRTLRASSLQFFYVKIFPSILVLSILSVYYLSLPTSRGQCEIFEILKVPRSASGLAPNSAPCHQSQSLSSSSSILIASSIEKNAVFANIINGSSHFISCSNIFFFFENGCEDIIIKFCSPYVYVSRLHVICKFVYSL